MFSVITTVCVKQNPSHNVLCHHQCPLLSPFTSTTPLPPPPPSPSVLCHHHRHLLSPPSLYIPLPPPSPPPTSPIVLCRHHCPLLLSPPSLDIPYPLPPPTHSVPPPLPPCYPTSPSVLCHPSPCGSVVIVCVGHQGQAVRCPSTFSAGNQGGCLLSPSRSYQGLSNTDLVATIARCLVLWGWC